MATIAEILQQGLRCHQAGALQQAEQLYRLALQWNPIQPDALHLLGALASQMGNHAAGIEFLRQAVACRPADGRFHGTLGEAFAAQGELDAATASFRRAIQLLPMSPEAHYNLGNALTQQEKWDEAAACFQNALQLKPDFHEAHNNLGNVLLKQNKLEEAFVQYEKALQINPRYGEALSNLATTLHQQGRLEEAVAFYQQAVCALPESATAYNKLGIVLHQLERLTEAEACYLQAIRLKPEDAEAYSHLGELYSQQTKLEDAAIAYQRALLLNPVEADAHTGLGLVLGEQGKEDESVACLEAALRLQPTPRLRIVLATRLPLIYRSMAELQAWRQRVKRGIQQLHEDHIVMDLTDQPVLGSMFYLAYQGFNDRDILRDMARLYKAPQQDNSCAARQQPKNGKIRVGFISRNFKNHTIGQLMRGLVAEFSRGAFEVTVLSVGNHQDEFAGFFKRHADRYLQIPLSLPAARRLIAEQELDVLFYTDIGMDQWTATLAHTRLAPVQCVTWGHPVTTGIDNVDYFISSETLEMEGAEEHYTETLVQLKNLAVYYYRPELPCPLKQRADFELNAEDNVYACPQTLFKFHPEFDDILAAILRADPRGQLVLINGIHAHWAPLLQRRFEATMSDVTDRVRFLPALSRADFVNLMAVSDVLLDPIHFGGGNTSYEGLAVGTPIVTLPSQFLRGRITFALYQRMGVMDCVVNTPEEYVARALRLGTDPAYRETVRQKILAANDVLFENSEGVRELEQFLREAVETAWRGQQTNA